MQLLTFNQRACLFDRFDVVNLCGVENFSALYICFINQVNQFFMNASFSSARGCTRERRMRFLISRNICAREIIILRGCAFRA